MVRLRVIFKETLLLMLYYCFYSKQYCKGGVLWDGEDDNTAGQEQNNWAWAERVVMSTEEYVIMRDRMRSLHHVFLPAPAPAPALTSLGKVFIGTWHKRSDQPMTVAAVEAAAAATLVKSTQLEIKRFQLCF